MTLLMAILALILPGVALAAETPAKPAPAVTLYKTAQSAACSDDVAVWVDPDARVFYVRGDALYGKTRRGGYNCRRQVEAAGYRAARVR